LALSWGSCADALCEGLLSIFSFVAFYYYPVIGMIVFTRMLTWTILDQNVENWTIFLCEVTHDVELCVTVRHEQQTPQHLFCPRLEDIFLYVVLTV
jgi:hypothetical protein